MTSLTMKLCYGRHWHVRGGKQYGQTMLLPWVVQCNRPPLSMCMQGDAMCLEVGAEAHVVVYKLKHCIMIVVVPQAIGYSSHAACTILACSIYRKPN